MYPAAMRKLSEALKIGIEQRRILGDVTVLDGKVIGRCMRY